MTSPLHGIAAVNRANRIMERTVLLVMFSICSGCLPSTEDLAGKQYVLEGTMHSCSNNAVRDKYNESVEMGDLYHSGRIDPSWLDNCGVVVNPASTGLVIPDQDGLGSAFIIFRKSGRSCWVEVAGKWSQNELREELQRIRQGMERKRMITVISIRG